MSSGLSHKAPKCVDLMTYVGTLPKDQPLVCCFFTDNIYCSQLRPMIHVCQVFVVGGLAHGKVEADYAEEEIAISHYPLSASVVCGKICNALEHMWEVL